MPKVRDAMHRKMVNYYERVREEFTARDERRQWIEEALQARRHVGPALHAAISEALANFALHFVP
ncbi:MAG: hypothetical protein HC771_24915, partial [Synechococcales cyanobacterium CRU_2_2]|nr:hypothetical protein [Synechococcales cyanobacterium CRU_2_2]